MSNLEKISNNAIARMRYWDNYNKFLLSQRLSIFDYEENLLHLINKDWSKFLAN